MNDIGSGNGHSSNAKSLMILGSILVAIPLFCLFVMTVSTGHQVTDSDAWFFNFAYLGLFSGCFTVPVGIVIFIVGLTRLPNTNKGE